MGLYWQIARRGFRRYATYRAATAAGIFTNTVFGFIRAYVFITLLKTAGDIGGYTLRDTLTYTFVTQGRMRGDLAAAMLHDPEIVFLDEPTIGLDVVAKERIRRFLAELNTERGVTVILTTHDLSDVERLCRRILIIDRGRLIYDGDLGGVAESFEAESTLVVDLYEPRPPIEVPGATVARVDGPRQWLKFRRGETSAAELIATVAASVPLADLSLEEPAIEEIVREIYERGLRRGETSVGRRPTTWPRR
jgi:ABC-2 type transport system ATP-binding protein